MKSYTLFELNEYLRRVVALNSSDAIWISCEIAQISESKGHHYVDLIQKEDEGDAIIAHTSAVIWEKTFWTLRRTLGRKLQEVFKEGYAVLLKVRVDYHERYGLKLVIENIDPAYTVGHLAMQRQKTIERLQKIGIIDENKEQLLPKVLQRIAVISSRNSAGFQDYLNQLKENEFAYQFKNELFPATVQGVFAEKEILNQLERIVQRKTEFDCVIIVRGGGAKLDLMAFDRFDLCKRIATFPLPVFSGIGHDVDETVLDLVAFVSLKTPTAVADFIVHHNMRFEAEIIELSQALNLSTLQYLKEEEVALDHFEKVLKIQSTNQLKNSTIELQNIESEIPRLISFQLKIENNKLDFLENLTQLLSPEETLKRGFTLNFLNGKIINSAKQLKKGDILETHFKDGTVEVEVLKN